MIPGEWSRWELRSPSLSLSRFPSVHGSTRTVSGVVLLYKAYNAFFESSVLSFYFLRYCVRATEFSQPMATCLRPFRDPGRSNRLSHPCPCRVPVLLGFFSSSFRSSEPGAKWFRPLISLVSRYLSGELAQFPACTSWPALPFICLAVLIIGHVQNGGLSAVLACSSFTLTSKFLSTCTEAALLEQMELNISGPCNIHSAAAGTGGIQLYSQFYYICHTIPAIATTITIVVLINFKHFVMYNYSFISTESAACDRGLLSKSNFSWSHFLSTSCPRSRSKILLRRPHSTHTRLLGRSQRSREKASWTWWAWKK